MSFSIPYKPHSEWITIEITIAAPGRPTGVAHTDLSTVAALSAPANSSSWSRQLNHNPASQRLPRPQLGGTAHALARLRNQNLAYMQNAAPIVVAPGTYTRHDDPTVPWSHSPLPDARQGGGSWSPPARQGGTSRSPSAYQGGGSRSPPARVRLPGSSRSPPADRPPEPYYSRSTQPDCVKVSNTLTVPKV